MFSFVKLLFTINVVNNVHMTYRKEVNFSSTSSVCICRCVLIVIHESALHSDPKRRFDVLVPSTLLKIE